MEISDLPYRNPILNYCDENIWGNPTINSCYPFKIMRISGDFPATNYITYMGEEFILPTSDDRYHIYTLGGLNPNYYNFKQTLNLNNPFKKWIKLSDMMQERGCYIELYTQQGLQYPKDMGYVMHVANNVTLLCIKHYDLMGFKTWDHLYLRAYSTDLLYDHDFRVKNSEYVFRSKSYFYDSLKELNKVRALIEEYERLGFGFLYIFINGYLYLELPKSTNLAVGCLIELVFDPTVEKVEYYKIDTLKEFYSELDEKGKYIIHPPKTDDLTLSYYDDNDFYIINKQGKGIYYHRNSEDSVRQLTHKDYSVTDEYCRYTSSQLGNTSLFTDNEIMVIYRHNNVTPILPYESSRIRYLYRQDDQGILNSLTGVYSYVPEWTATKLESSFTSTYRRTRFKDLSLELGINTLGYNSLGTVMSQSPLYTGLITPNTNGYRIPETYRDYSVVFEYNQLGDYLTHYEISNVNGFLPKHEEAVRFEFIMGRPSKTLNYVLGNDDVIIPNDSKQYHNFGYRCYYSDYRTIDEQVVGNWVDDTDTKEHYELEDGRVVWNLRSNQIGLVVFNDTFLLYEFELDHIDKSLDFQITHLSEGGGVELPIPPANIEIFMNGKYLIENVDYYLDYPNVYVFNRQYLKEGPQSFIVRGHGLYDLAKSPIRHTEIGYVMGGCIGTNKIYNVRDGRPATLVINGRVMNVSDMKCLELDEGNDMYYEYNGFPYMVKHNYVPITYAVDYNNYPLFETDRDLDKRITTHLTEFLPKQEVTVPLTMNDKYQLFSPFMNKVIMDLYNKVLDIKPLESGTKYANQYIKEVLNGYEKHLVKDPIKHGYDQKFFLLSPISSLETIELTPDQFTFVCQVNGLYMNNQCIIEGYLEVSNV